MTMQPAGQSGRPVDEGVSRRDFLRFGGLSVLGLSVAEQKKAVAARAAAPGTRSCIFLLLTGGPSHLETFDPKPDAPGNIRGPFNAISTSVPGLALSETLPLCAARADRFSILRTLHHQAAPIHETGQQLIQTGRLARRGFLPPGFGAVLASRPAAFSTVPVSVVLPRLLGNTGVAAWNGQQAGSLGEQFNPRPLSGDGSLSQGVSSAVESAVSALSAGEADAFRRPYGETRFGQHCWLARRLVECGVRFVTVNMFDTLVGQTTWDAHAQGPWSPTRLSDYRDVLCPDFDRAFTALLDDLEIRGLLATTLVVAVGEFGRTPRINRHGGRDHWTGTWSALLAGGGLAAGRTVGVSDARGMFPLDRPVVPAELAATVYHALGLDCRSTFSTTDGTQHALADAGPLAELIA